LALYRGGRPPARSGAQGLGADWLHDRFADRVADCGSDSAALYGRYRGPPVPRIRGHTRRHDPGLRGRVADADSDDVRAAAEAYAGIREGLVLPQVRAGL